MLQISQWLTPSRYPTSGEAMVPIVHGLQALTVNPSPTRSSPFGISVKLLGMLIQDKICYLGIFSVNLINSYMFDSKLCEIFFKTVVLWFKLHKH